MDYLNSFTVPVVLTVCLIVGAIIKQSLTFIPNKYIPLIMAVVGLVLNMWMNNWLFNIDILLGGLASGLASTGTYELVRNVIEKKKGD